MKRGRPRDINKAKNRVHSVVLTKEAEIVYREACSSIGNKKWLNKMISKEIIEKFGLGRGPILRQELIGLQEQADELYEQINQKADEIKQIDGST